MNAAGPWIPVGGKHPLPVLHDDDWWRLESRPVLVRYTWNPARPQGVAMACATRERREDGEPEPPVRWYRHDSEAMELDGVTHWAEVRL